MNPVSTPADLARARAWLGKGDTQQAQAQLQEALRHDPESLPALATLMNVSIRQGKSQEAVQRISALLQQNPRNAGLHFLLAVGYFSLHDLEKSEASVRQAITLDPKTPDAYSLLANIDFTRGAVEEGKADLRSAIEANPHMMWNFVALGTEYERENNWEEAKRLFEKAHAIDPGAPLVAAELALLYLEHGGDVNMAVSLAQNAKQKMPNSPVTADALGWAYYKLGSGDLAVSQLKESTQKVPKNPVYQYHLGMAYMTARNFDMAARSLRMALKNDPKFANAASANAALDTIAKQAR
jgi:tetratricopeptide (TPR) repeat protein